MSMESIPLEPHLFIAKLEYAGVCRGIPFVFLFLLRNIDCGYSLELPHLCYGKNKKNVQKIKSTENFQSLQIRRKKASCFR